MKTSHALCAVLALAACGQTDTKSGPPKPAPTQPDPTPLATAPDAGAAVKVARKIQAPKPGKLELLEPGAEPRFQLAYQVPAGAQQTMQMSMDVTAEVPVAGKMVMPTMLMTASVVVTSVDPTGKMISKMTFSDMQVVDNRDSTPGLADVLKSQIGDIKGTGVTMTILPSGQVESWTLDTSPDPGLQQTVGQTQQGLDQMVVQVPDKPIGKGGKWKLKQTVEQQGMKIDQTTTYEVLEVTATTVKLKATAVMTAPKQDVDQEGSTLGVEKLGGSAKTDLDIDFTRMVPTVASDISMKMTTKIAGTSAETTMHTKMKITPQ